MTVAVASLLSGGMGFFRGAVVLGHALKEHASGVDHVLLVETGCYTGEQIDYLSKVGWLIEPVEPLRSQPADFRASRWPATFTKLHLWAIGGYDRVLYMDTDACPFASLAEVLDLSPTHLAASRTRRTRERFRSGMMMVRPSQAVFAELRELLGCDPAINDAHLGDQGLLNVYFRGSWEMMPPHYHVCDWQRKPSDVIVAHLRPKPWEKGRPRSAMVPYTAEWRAILSRCVTEYGPIPCAASDVTG